MTDYRTPLRRARGLGSAKSGVGRYIGERVSAVALAPLSIWGLWSAVKLSRGGYAEATAWLRSPVNAALLVLLSAASLYHMQLGMRVIVEDYIHRPLTKTVLLLANAFLCWGLAAVALVAILKVAFGGGGA